MNDNGKYFCFEHGVEYTYDDLMCKQCETEICESNDIHFKEKQMTEQFVPQKTTYIQEESVTNFMAALGYEPVYGYLSNSSGDNTYGLLRFTQPRFYKTGEVNVSVNRAIKLHNNSGEESFAELTGFTRFTELREYLRDFKNYKTILNVAAGSTKIVEQVKGSWSRKKGFQVHDHNIKFMTNRDKRQNSHLIGF